MVRLALLALVSVLAAPLSVSAQVEPSTRPAGEVRGVVVQFLDGSEQRFVQAAAPAPAPLPVEPGPTTRRGKSLLGVNVGAVSDHSRNVMFIDAIKSSREFGRPDKPWAKGVILDKNGWPAEDAGVVVFTEQVDVNGAYKFSCTGRVDLQVVDSDATVENLAYDTNADRTTADVVVRAPTGKPSRLFLSFRNTTGGIRDIKLLRPGYDDDAAIFTREFLAALEPFGTLRFMDYSSINDSKVVNWDDRNRPETAQYTNGRGGPWEYAVEAGNHGGKDVWLCIPHRATDAFVTELAKMVKARIKPGINVYVEYSNEVWNSQFSQNKANVAMAKAEIAAGDATLVEEGKEANKYYSGWRRVGKRTAEIGKIFRAEFGEADAHRVRPVLCGQNVLPDVLRLGLRYIEQHVGEPRDVIYAIGSAPYMGHDKELFKQEGATVDQIAEMMLRRVTAANGKCVAANHKLAEKYGVKHVAYEGGVDLGQADVAVEAKIGAQFDERAGQFVEQYLRNWFEGGGDVFVYYNLVSRYSKHGFWGLTDDLRNLGSPKMRAAVRVAGEFREPESKQD